MNSYNKQDQKKVKISMVVDRQMLEAVKAATFEPKAGTAIVQAARRYLAMKEAAR